MCPFHKDRNPSLSLDLRRGLFHCFSCGTSGGSVIDFVMVRDSCTFKTACKTLGCWRDINESERQQLASEATRRKREREQAARAREAERSRRIELRDEIHTLVEVQAEVSARLSELLQATAPAYENEVESCWSVLTPALDDLRECEAESTAMIRMECAA